MGGPRFESLGAETFQRFCQSLLTYEAPDLQALEVGQPDGGRDAFHYPRAIGVSHPYAIFQVKFVRSGKISQDPEEWIAGVLKAELPKIERLVERGASSYRLITNAMGSAHLDTGAVDKVAKYLSETVPIPADCWWRNDLEVRLAKYPELRWAYPDLLTPTDILKELVGLHLSEDAQRRTNALQAFLIAQHKAEKDVRFKQVDLQRDLLNLFIDVPVSAMPGGAFSPTQRIKGLITKLGPTASPLDKRSAGAAELLLRPEAADVIPHVVLEGAPGQGKSTLAQYLCQVHRMRLLKKTAELRRVPKTLHHSPIRLPFKIDLRDLAAFLRGRDPFEDDPEWGGLPENFPRSLEAFLTSLVMRFSGGARFDISDFHAILDVSHLLVVFDGLDEVAELGDRRVVVDAIKAGIERLEGMALGLQTVVTSRPAAFTQSPGFSPVEVPHLQLISITEELALDYCDRWTVARGLTPSEGHDVRKLLERQLVQPHIKDLARNPMQLAILLTLILTKGDSLPDKRTDLYTSYLGVFFDREAAKGDLVRDHRDTLMALHRYLAWTLHCGAELWSASGSISEADLKAAVVQYLERQDVDLGLADELFQGVVERIFALVSRVQGRFEFEVQPLREYFAASYLYSTAQVSRVGHERPGTLLDRFDGLARNPFWLNVVRFYAGFYETGQLPSLVYRLKALRDDPAWSATDQARKLAAMFLQDWSFALDRDSREDAIAIALDELGTRHDLEASGVSDAPILLPQGAGQEQVLQRCWDLVEVAELPNDRKQAIYDLMTVGRQAMADEWLDRLEATSGPSRTELLHLGQRGGLLGDLPKAQWSLLWGDGHTDHFSLRASWAVTSGLAESVEADEEKCSLLLAALHDGSVVCDYEPKASGWMSIYGLLLQPLGVSSLAYFDELFPILKVGLATLDESELCPTAELVRDIVRSAIGKFDEDVPSQRVIEQLLEASRAQWGESYALYRGAAQLVAQEGRPARRGQAVDILDSTVPLVRRIRHARARGGKANADWWSKQLESAKSRGDKMATLIVALSWPTKEALNAILGPAAQHLKALDEQDFLEVCQELQRLGWGRGAGRSPFITSDELDAMDARVAIALSHRDPEYFGRHAFRRRFQGYRGKKLEISSFVLQRATADFLNGRSTEADHLATIRRAYKVTAESWDEAAGLRFVTHESVPLTTAEAVVRNAEEYPFSIVRAAEEICSLSAGRKAESLASISENEHWFEDA